MDLYTPPLVVILCSMIQLPHQSAQRQFSGSVACPNSLHRFVLSPCEPYQSNRCVHQTTATRLRVCSLLSRESSILMTWSQSTSPSSATWSSLRGCSPHQSLPSQLEGSRLLEVYSITRVDSLTSPRLSILRLDSRLRIPIIMMGCLKKMPRRNLLSCSRYIFRAFHWCSHLTRRRQDGWPGIPLAFETGGLVSSDICPHKMRYLGR